MIDAVDYDCWYLENIRNVFQRMIDAVDYDCWYLVSSVRNVSIRNV
jgi:hypothetical protein